MIAVSWQALRRRIMVVIAAGVLLGCPSPTDPLPDSETGDADVDLIGAELDLLTFDDFAFATGDGRSRVTADFTVPVTGENTAVEITWSSSDEGLVHVLSTGQATVNVPIFPEPRAYVVLTATLSYGVASGTKDFPLLVGESYFAELHPDSSQGNDYFGRALDVSDSLLIAGAWGRDGVGTDSGIAVIFECDNETWSERALLQAPDAQADDQFGFSVAVSGDYALVGAPWEAGGTGDPSPYSGTVYAFERIDGTWIHTDTLRASNAGAGDEFGFSLSMCPGYAVVGARGEDGGTGDPAPDCGAAYVFARSGSNWSEVAVLRASDAQAYDGFGGSVGICDDYAIVGASSEDGGPGDPVPVAGAAYVYSRTSGWGQTAKLQAASRDTQDYFGCSVAITNTYAVVGAICEDGSPYVHDSGSAYVFVNYGGSWAQRATLRAMDAAEDDHFGSAVDVRPGAILVGAANASRLADYVYYCGAAYLFSGSGSSWEQVQKLEAPESDSWDSLGSRVALGATFAAVGAYSQNGPATDPADDAGAVYIFR